MDLSVNINPYMPLRHTWLLKKKLYIFLILKKLSFPPSPLVNSYLIKFYKHLIEGKIFFLLSKQKTTFERGTHPSMFCPFYVEPMTPILCEGCKTSHGVHTHYNHCSDFKVGVVVIYVTCYVSCDRFISQSRLRYIFSFYFDL